METIKDKLRKIKALAEQGVEGEARAAQYQLEKLLAKHNISIEDLFEEKRQERAFKVSRSENQLFIQTLAKNIGERLKECYYYKRKPSVQYIELTDQEYVDVEQQFSFYKKQLKKEMKKAADQLMQAFCIKHDLFNKDRQPVEREDSKMTYEEYRQIMGYVNNLEDVTFKKQLTN